MKATPAQLAAYVGKSERTIHRWLASGKYPHSRLPGGLIEIEDSLLIGPEGENERTVLAALQRVERKLDDLTALVATLTALSQPLQSLVRHSEPRRDVAPVNLPEPPADLPPGALQYYQLAERYGVVPRTFRDQIIKGWIDALIRPKLNRPGENAYWLTPEQQQAALQFWIEHGTPHTKPLE